MCYDSNSKSRHATIVHDGQEADMREDMLAEARLVIDVIRDYAERRGVTDALDQDRIFDIFVEEFQSLY